jgi:hypothetical protein
MRFDEGTVMLISGRLRWPLTEKIYTGTTEVKPVRSVHCDRRFFRREDRLIAR